MRELINDIQKDINGEKLLFSNREDYTLEERKMIVKSISNRVNKTYNYCELIKDYVPKVEEIVKSLQDDSSLINDTYQVATHIRIHKKKSEEMMLDDFGFITYTMRNNLGYAANEKYSDVVLNRLFPVEEVRDFFEGNKVIYRSKDWIDFIITNNYMIRKYPNFYSEEDLCTLKTAAKKMERSVFSSKEEYQEFKFARKALLMKLTTKKDKVLIKRR